MNKLATYEDGLHDGQQLKIFIDFIRVSHYIEEYMGKSIQVALVEDHAIHSLTTKKFADELAKVIVNRSQEKV